MTDTPAGDFKQQTNKNKGDEKKTETTGRKLEEEIKIVARDLETAKRERRGTGVTPFWVSTQGNQLRLDTLTLERNGIERKGDHKTNRKGQRKQNIGEGDYQDWENKQRKELEKTVREINRISAEISRLEREESENKRRIRVITKVGNRLEGEIEDRKWDSWCNYNLLQRNLALESELIEKAQKIEKDLTKEGQVEEK